MPDLPESPELRREHVFRQAINTEASDTEKHLWWLSFTDPDIAATIPPGQQRPGGPSWLGVCIVEAATMPGAILAAHANHCNPGGEVAAYGPAPRDTWPREYWNRLLNFEEVERINHR